MYVPAPPAYLVPEEVRKSQLSWDWSCNVNRCMETRDQDNVISVLSTADLSLQTQDIRSLLLKPPRMLNNTPKYFAFKLSNMTKTFKAVGLSEIIKP